VSARYYIHVTETHVAAGFGKFVEYVITHKKRYSDEEIERARELLAVDAPNVVARKLGRSTESLRQKCKRQRISVRETQRDFFTVDILAKEAKVRKSTVCTWVKAGFLETSEGRIDPEAIKTMIRESLPDLARLGHVKSSALIQLNQQYCYTPKHTTDKQPLQVREAKRNERLTMRN